MLRLLHCADLHLDAPFIMDDSRKAEARKNEMRGTFSSLMLYVKTNHIGIVLFAGDVFDSLTADSETLDTVKRGFAENPECKFIISPGEHDFVCGGRYMKTDFPDNVYIFKTEKLGCFQLTEVGDDRENVNVYGYAFCSPEIKASPLVAGIGTDKNAINLFCGHGEITDKESSCCPIRPEELEKTGIDYFAFGHIHNAGKISKIGNGCYAYSGCLEGHNFGECGYKGAIVAVIDKSGGVGNVSAKYIRFSKRRFEIITLDVTGAGCTEEVTERIKKSVAENKFGSDTVLRVVLEGETSSGLIYSGDILKRELEGVVFEAELEDNTIPTGDIDELAEDLTLKGALFGELAVMLKSDDAAKRKKAAEAVKILQRALAADKNQ